MALSGTVTGAGKVIDTANEPGEYSYIFSSLDQDPNGAEPTTVQKQVTVTYTDVRETRKWYGLTLAAVEDYITANPTKVVNATCVSEPLNAYEMTATTSTRTITSVTATAVPEAE